MRRGPWRLRAAAALVVVVAAFVGAYVGFAPSHGEICDDLFELAGGPEQALQEVTRSECEAAYLARRSSRGTLGFAALGWCVTRARSLGEAGRC